MTARVLSDYEWRKGAAVVQATLETLDDNSIRGINGEDGEGAFTPAADLTIAGEIQVWHGTLSIPSTKSPGSVVLGDASRAKSSYGNNKFAPASDSYGCCPNQVAMSATYPINATTKQRYVKDAPTFTSIAPLRSARVALPLRVRHGMTLSIVRFDYVEEAHTDVPEIAARVRVVRMSADGVVEPIGGDPSYDEEGWAHFIYTSAPAGGGNFYNYTCNYSVTVDTENYVYFAEMIGEGGADSYPVRWLSAMCPEGGDEGEFE